jgi:hypothetical protein
LPVRPLLVPCLLATALSGQVSSSADEVALRRAVSGLAEPLHARAAADALVALGAAAVPPLQALVDAPQRYVEPRDRVLGALFVLGRLGAAAVPALPAVERACGDHDAAIARQALWALGEVGRAAPEDQRADLAARLETATDYLAQVTRARLRLGSAPATARLRDELASADPAAVVAACHFLHPPLPAGIDGDGGPAAWRELVHRQLALALAPAALPWDEHVLRPAAPDLAAAWLGLGGGDADLLVGRGLLQHWDAQLRRKGLSRLAGDETAPLGVRAELLRLLFDQDAEVRQLAAWQFGAWGRAGLLALPALLRLEDKDPDVGMRLSCRKACGDLRTAWADQAAGLAAFEARLRGGAEAPLPAPGDAAGATLLAELLCGAEWTDAAVVRRLLPTPVAGRALPPDLQIAVLRLCANLDGGIRAVAAGWIARHGRDAGLGDPSRAMLFACLSSGADDGNLVEALAWVLAGADATEAELRRAGAHGSPRVQVHALCELAKRRAQLTADEEKRVRALLGEARTVLLDSDESGDKFKLGVDCRPFVDAAATLLLAAAGASFDVGPLLALASAGSDEAAAVRRWLAARDFQALGALLEARMREALRVDAAVPP